MLPGTMQERNDLRASDSLFPGQKITSRALTRDIASVKTGACRYRDVPWVLQQSRNILDKRQELASSERFDRNDLTQREQYAQLLRRSVNEPDVAKELAAYRTFELSMNVFASPFALSAFQTIDLSADELPAIVTPQSAFLNSFNVYTVAQSGDVRQAQITSTKDWTSYEIDMIATDKVEYPLYDIQMGQVQPVDWIDAQLNYDYEMKIDQLALANIDSAKVISGLRDVMHFHPLIKQANVPDTNYLDLRGGAYGTKGVINILKLKTLLAHVAKFGAVMGAFEPMTMQSIHLSPMSLQDPWDFIDLVASGDGTVSPKASTEETVPTSVREAIYSTGMFSSAWGYNFSWVPNAQLEVTVADGGRMYIFTSQPLGWFFTKSAFDMRIEWNGPEQQQNNYGQVMFKKPSVFVVPDLWRHHILIVDY